MSKKRGRNSEVLVQVEATKRHDKREKDSVAVLDKVDKRLVRCLTQKQLAWGNIQQYRNALTDQSRVLLLASYALAMQKDIWLHMLAKEYLKWEDLVSLAMTCREMWMTMASLIPWKTALECALPEETLDDLESKENTRKSFTQIVLETLDLPTGLPGFAREAKGGLRLNFIRQQNFITAVRSAKSWGLCGDCLCGIETRTPKRWIIGAKHVVNMCLDCFRRCHKGDVASSQPDTYFTPCDFEFTIDPRKSWAVEEYDAQRKRGELRWPRPPCVVNLTEQCVTYYRGRVRHFRLVKRCLHLKPEIRQYLRDVVAFLLWKKCKVKAKLARRKAAEVPRHVIGSMRLQSTSRILERVWYFYNHGEFLT